MTDVRTYTAASVPPWATAITETTAAGELGTAKLMFCRAAADTSPDDAVYAVAAAVEPGPNEIRVGEAALVFGNPLRNGFAWRCGTCLHAFRSGGRLPTSGVNYRTHQGALRAAPKHATEDHDDGAIAIAIKEITR